MRSSGRRRGAWLRWLEDDLGAEVRLETIRSAGPDSLLGIDTNSLVVRLKRGWGYARLQPLPWLRLEGRLGLIPDLWVERIEQGYDLRGLAPTTGEGALLLDTSDGGASASLEGWGGAVALAVAVVNGEGRNQRELNEGKNTTAVLSARPLRFAWGGAPAELALHLGYRDGSTGIARVVDNRLMAGLTFRSRYAWAGAEWLRADSFQGREVEAEAQGLWANACLGLPWLGALARWDRQVDDLATPERARSRLTGGLYLDLIAPGWPDEPRRFRLLLTAQREEAAPRAAPLPGAPELAALWRGALILDLSGRAETP